MAQQREVFLASADARRAISRRAYILFGVGAALMMCGAAAVGIIFATINPPNTLLIGAAGAVACAGVAGLIVGIVNLARLRQRIQVEVTPYRITWREGKATATTEFEDVVRVELVKDTHVLRSGRTAFYPVVRFIESNGEMLEFEATFEDRGYIHTSRFDARAITKAALPHLPQHAVIAPQVEDFARTGTVNVDTLPDR